MCLNQPFGQIRVNIFVLVTDTDIYTDRGDSCRLGTGRDLNLVLRWMWGFLPHLAGLPSFRRFLFATIAYMVYDTFLYAVNLRS